MAEEPRQRIGFVATFFLLLTAGLFDGVQFLVLFIPGIDVVVEFFVTVIALAVFGVWFAILGVNYFSGEQQGAKVIAMFSSSVVELVPLLDALPGITLGVWGVISAIKKEDVAAKLAFYEQEALINQQRQGQGQAQSEEYADVEVPDEVEEELEDA